MVINLLIIDCNNVNSSTLLHSNVCIINSSIGTSLWHSINWYLLVVEFQVSNSPCHSDSLEEMSNLSYFNGTHYDSITKCHMLLLWVCSVIPVSPAMNDVTSKSPSAGHGVFRKGAQHFWLSVESQKVLGGFNTQTTLVGLIPKLPCWVQFPNRLAWFCQVLKTCSVLLERKWKCIKIFFPFLQKYSKQESNSKKLSDI